MSILDLLNQAHALETATTNSTLPLPTLCCPTPVLVPAPATVVHRDPTEPMTDDSRLCPYVHLHVHTSEGSPGDALCTADQLAARAAALKQPALAITDHGSISAWWKHAAACRDHNIKPIFGIEIYLAEGNKNDKRATISGRRAYHLTLLAETNEGRDNLIRVNNIAHRDGFYYHPRVDIDDLRAHSKGIICLTGCLSGPVAQSILAGQPHTAERWIEDLTAIFGRNNLFVEIQPNNLPAQIEVNAVLIGLAGKLGLPLVATCDCHYATAAQSPDHDNLICVTRKEKANVGRDKRYAPGQFSVRSGAAVMDVLTSNPQAIENTLVIAERCNVDLKLGMSLLPRFETPDNAKPEDYLSNLLCERIVAMNLDNENYMARLKHELSVISGQGFASYFLLVAELVNWAKKKGIQVGPGRGSAVGSLVAYVLCITALDPIHHGLLFERFLMPGRVSLPDIDIDFEKDRREEVIAHLAERYNVLPILTRSFLKIKGAIRDAGRVLDVPLPIVNSMAAQAADDEEDRVDDHADVAAFFDRHRGEDPTGGKWIDSAKGLCGAVRGLGRHASGLLLLDKNTDTSLIPIQRTGDEIVAAWDMDDVDAVGALKLDVLGLSTLTVLEKILADPTVASAFANPTEWERNTPQTYRMLASGKTISVFQLESYGMQDLLRRVQPVTFEDVIATISLFRPGSLDSGQTDLFVQARQGMAIVHADARINDILRDTAGVVVYQEQIMKLAKRVAGFSDAESDGLRKVVAKKLPEKMRPILDKFVAGAVANGLSERDARQLAATIEEFGGYGFNKSHAAAYALLAFQMAWLKASFPAHFWAARLSVPPSGKEAKLRFSQYLRASVGDGVLVLPPTVNDSGVDFTVEPSGVRFGFSRVKCVGAAAPIIVNERSVNGPFIDLIDLYRRLQNVHVGIAPMVALARCGALDNMGASRVGIVEQLNYLHKHRNRKTPPPPFSASGETESIWDRILSEFELLEAPLATALDAVFPADTELDLEQLDEGRPTTIGGRVSKTEEKMARNGNTFQKIWCDGAKGQVLAMAFSDCIERCPACSDVKAGDFVTITGQFDGQYRTFKADDLVVVNDAAVRVNSRQ
ncbi:MAG: DNA polymerase III subunit alpha [Planctomycetota bacterium]